jgi:hypothetical protein
MCPPLWRAYERVQVVVSISYAAKGIFRLQLTL